MALTFRNLTVTPDEQVEAWRVEGVLSAIERGGAEDWARIVAAVVADPAGETAKDVEQALDIAESPGAVATIRHAIERRLAGPREATVARLRAAFLATELTQAQVAARLGTSASRVSTYLSGRVVPSAEFLVRLEALARRRIDEVSW